jgi:AraC-like DNA-binding protein
MAKVTVGTASRRGVRVTLDTTGIRHGRVIDRFEEFLETNYDWPVRLANICAAIAVSERMLRLCCQDLLGVSPMCYMRLRQMYLAHVALMGADQATATVAGIATHFGFFELGRFSVNYRALFGESPSITLHRCCNSPPESRKSHRHPVISHLQTQ